MSSVQICMTHVGWQISAVNVTLQPYFKHMTDICSLSSGTITPNNLFLFTFFFTFQAQLKPVRGASSPQLSASSVAPWTLAPAPVQLR